MTATAERCLRCAVLLPAAVTSIGAAPPSAAGLAVSSCALATPPVRNSELHRPTSQALEDYAAFGIDDTGEMMIWNPTEMKVIGTVELEIPEKDGEAAHLMDIIQRDDGSLIQSYWYWSEDGEGLLDGAGVVFVVPEKKEVIARDVMEGCNYSRRLEKTEDGTVWLQWERSGRCARSTASSTFPSNRAACASRRMQLNSTGSTRRRTS